LAFLVRARYPSSGKQHSLEVGWRRKTSTEESPKGCGDPGFGYRIEPPPDISPRRLISRPDREDDPSGEGRHPGDHAVVEEVMP
jgi:hypothetical protein